jgi:hypothetical protein
MIPILLCFGYNRCSQMGISRVYNIGVLHPQRSPDFQLDTFSFLWTRWWYLQHPNSLMQSWTLPCSDHSNGLSIWSCTDILGRDYKGFSDLTQVHSCFSKQLIFSVLLTWEVNHCWLIFWGAFLYVHIEWINLPFYTNRKEFFFFFFNFAV